MSRGSGVSTATVYRVLNDRGGVKPEEEIKVLSAARRLKLDRILTRRYLKVLRIAVLIQSSANPFHAALRDACGAVGRAYADLNPQFLIHHIDPGDASEIAAAILRLGPRQAIREVAQRIPVITLATDLPESGRWAYVGPDDRRAGRVAGDLMGRFLGREGGDIVMIAGLLSLVGQRERDAGFRQVLRERYPACRISAVFETRESAERAGLAILEAPEVRGVYHMTAGAFEAISALRSQGRSEDVVVIAHELTEDRRALLKERAIDAIIDQNPEFEVRTATELMAQFLGRMEGVASTTITALQVYISENV